MTTVTRISENRWTLSNGARIWLDDFGTYQVSSNTDFEETRTLDEAIELASSERFSK